jgi:hypothetical protein
MGIAKGCHDYRGRSESISHLISGLPRGRVELPPGVSYITKPWQPLNVLITATQ